MLQVSGSDPKGHQDRQEGIGPRGNAYGLRRTAIAGDRLLEGFDLRAKDELLGGKDLVNLRAYRLGQGGVLGAEVEQGHAHGSEMMAVSTRRSIGSLAAAHAR